MDTSDVYTQVFQSLMPLIQIAIVLWAAETIFRRFARTVIAGRATNTRSSVSDNKNRGRGTILYPPSIFYQFSPLSILLIVNHRNAASADCFEMRAAEYLSVGL